MGASNWEVLLVARIHGYAMEAEATFNSMLSDALLARIHDSLASCFRVCYLPSPPRWYGIIDKKEVADLVEQADFFRRCCTLKECGAQPRDWQLAVNRFVSLVLRRCVQFQKVLARAGMSACPRPRGGEQKKHCNKKT